MTEPDFESFSYYGIPSPMFADSYPKEFVDYVRVETRFAALNLWDMPGGHKDWLSIELLCMRWLSERERDAWNKRDLIGWRNS